MGGRGRDRYASIMKYYESDDLQAIFNDVMRQNKEALRRAKGLSGAGSIADTADMSNPLQLAMGEGVEAERKLPQRFSSLHGARLQCRVNFHSR